MGSQQRAGAAPCTAGRFNQLLRGCDQSECTQLSVLGMKERCSPLLGLTAIS